MKKQILLFSMVFLCVIVSDAQIDKKDLLLGGTFGYGNSNSPGYSTSSNSNLNPRIGYAIGKNSVLNVLLGYNHGKSEDADGNVVSKSTGFSTGLSWQKFFPIKEKVGWYTDLYGSMNSGKTTQGYTAGNISKIKSNGYLAGVNPGIYYMPIPALLLTVNAGGISYNYSKQKSSGQPTGKNSSFSINLLNYFGFGIGFIINKKTS